MNFVSTNNGHYIYDRRTAEEFLESLGIDKEDFDSICGFMYRDNDYDTLKDRYDSLKDEFDAYEASLDARHSLLCEIQNICDEALSMQRISKSRERFKAISEMIYQEL